MYSLRNLGEQDFAAVAELSASLGRTCNPELWGSDECRLALFFEPENRLAAWARAHWWDPVDPIAPSGYYLGGVEVAAEFQGQGLARRLSRARLVWIAQRADEAFCTVNVRNTASVALQRSLGFTEQARAAVFGSVRFSGGEGILFRRALSESDIETEPVSATFTRETKDQ